MRRPGEHEVVVAGLRAMAISAALALAACQGAGPSSTGGGPAAGDAATAGKTATGDGGAAALKKAADAARFAKIDKAALLTGPVPAGFPESELIDKQCRVCHGPEYIPQQRLGEGGWKKTIDKMRRFGAVLSDDEAASVLTFVAHLYPPDLPDRPFRSAAPPPGALPSPAAK